MILKYIIYTSTVFQKDGTVLALLYPLENRTLVYEILDYGCQSLYQQGIVSLHYLLQYIGKEAWDQNPVYNNQ